jgi:hypothetical protein
VDGLGYALSLSDTAQYLAGGFSPDPGRPADRPQFALWDTASATPLWSFQPGTSGSTRADSAVQTTGQFMIGGWRGHIYFWGNVPGPIPSATPRTDYVLHDGGCHVDVAMTYHGAYSAVIDDLGRVRAFASVAGGDTSLWLPYYQL